jgi:hypothetical protein
MSEMGQMRRFRNVRGMSGLLSTSDVCGRLGTRIWRKSRTRRNEGDRCERGATARASQGDRIRPRGPETATTWAA